jgi:hypothetical protein
VRGLYGDEIMKDENFDPMQDKHMKIVIDVSQVVRYSHYAFIISVISVIISLIAFYRSGSIVG